MFCLFSKVAWMCKGESDSVPCSCRDNELDHKQKKYDSYYNHQLYIQMWKQAFGFWGTASIIGAIFIFLLKNHKSLFIKVIAQHHEMQNAYTLFTTKLMSASFKNGFL